jgi:hypothetical protein
MDIITIAQREANKAYEATEGSDYEKSGAYLETIRATRKRGYRAEGLLEAGAVSKDGGPGKFYVESQSGNGTYNVDVTTGTCTCPDHQRRGTYCKHLQAAELFQDQIVTTPESEQVVLEVEGYARGRQLLDKRVKRVRINGGSYRQAKNEDFDNALDWLRREGYEFADIVKPNVKAGTVTAKYFYRK